MGNIFSCCTTPKEEQPEFSDISLDDSVPIITDPIPRFNGKTDTLKLQINEVYDGDTVYAIIKREELIPTQLVQIPIRILSIDTPEKKTKNMAEKEAALLATEAMKRLVLNKRVYVKLTKHDKFGGRFDGTLMLEGGILISDIMILAGHGRPYKGDKKIPFDEWYDPNKIRDVEEVYHELLAKSTLIE